MADAPDSKSGSLTGVWVQVPPSVVTIYGDSATRDVANLAIERCHPPTLFFRLRQLRDDYLKLRTRSVLGYSNRCRRHVKGQWNHLARLLDDKTDAKATTLAKLRKYVIDRVTEGVEAATPARQSLCRAIIQDLKQDYRQVLEFWDIMLPLQVFDVNRENEPSQLEITRRFCET